MFRWILVIIEEDEMKLTKKMLSGVLTLTLLLFNGAFADDHDEQDMPPGAQEFFQTLQQTQGNFDAAFNAAEAVAKADAEANDSDYDAEEWEKCKNEALQAMQEALQNSQADNMEDKARDVFGATMFAAQLCSGDLPPEEQAFFTAIKSNEDPQSAFDAATEAAKEVAKQEIEEDGGQWDDSAEQEFEQQKSQAQQVFNESMENGMDPGQAFGEVMQAMYGDEGEYQGSGQPHQGGPPVGKNHFDGNCLALCGGHDRYMVEGSDDEFGVWTQDADGNDVNCDCDGYKKGDHEGGQHHDGGDHEGMSELDHMMEGLKGMLKQMVQDGLNQGDADYMMELAEGVEEATHSEYESPDNQGAAGEAKQTALQFAQAQGVNPGMVDDYMRQLDMIENAAHRENNGEMGGGPSPAVQDAFFGTYEQTGSYEAAFDAAEIVSKQEAQESGEYDEEQWNECAQVGKDAMMAAVQSGEQDPGKVFGALVMAVNGCGGQQGDCGVFMTNDMDGSIMVSTPDGQERWLMPDDFAMNEDGSVTILRQGEPDTGATVTPPPCDDNNGTAN